MLNRPILARRIHRLKDQQHGKFILGIHLLLVGINLFLEFAEQGHQLALVLVKPLIQAGGPFVQIHLSLAGITEVRGIDRFFHDQICASMWPGSSPATGLRNHHPDGVAPAGAANFQIPPARPAPSAAG